jgi:hypothetical protein
LYAMENYHPNGTPDTILSNYQKNSGYSQSDMINFQLDFVNPVNDYTKFETGVKGIYQESTSSSSTFNSPYIPGDQFVTDTTLTNAYSIDNFITAAYINYSSKLWGIGYQGGLRFEDSYYKGLLTNKNQSF